MSDERAAETNAVSHEDPGQADAGSDEVRGRESASTTCSPCRGTGRLISGLGGESHEVTCPWCGGTGEFVGGMDAQQAPAETP